MKVNHERQLSPAGDQRGFTIIDSGDRPAATDALDFQKEGGESGALIRTHDWFRTPLGPIEDWPSSLYILLGTILASPFPTMLAWGPHSIMLHNDAYRSLLGHKAATLGLPVLDVWAEISDTVAPLFDRAFAGEALRFADAPFTLVRVGRTEHCFFDFSLSPVRDEHGLVIGVLNSAVETTARLLAERRQAFWIGFEERLRDLPDPDAIMQAAVALLGDHLGADRVGYCEIVDDAIVRTNGSYAVNGIAPLNEDFPIYAFGEEMVARQRQGITEVSDDVQDDPERADDVWAAIDTRSVVSVPLVRDGRFVASLYVNNREPRRWTAEDVALIEEVAARTRDAVERARAEVLLRESEASLRALNETLERRVSAAIDERKLLGDVFEATDAFIQVIDPHYDFHRHQHGQRRGV